MNLMNKTKYQKLNHNFSFSKRHIRTKRNRILSDREDLTL